MHRSTSVESSCRSLKNPVSRDFPSSSIPRSTESGREQIEVVYTPLQTPPIPSRSECPRFFTLTSSINFFINLYVRRDSRKDVSSRGNRTLLVKFWRSPTDFDPSRFGVYMTQKWYTCMDVTNYILNSVWHRHWKAKFHTVVLLVPKEKGRSVKVPLF